MVISNNANTHISAPQKIVIFGAGFYGKLAFKQYTPQNVAFFVDNDTTKQGTLLCGKEVKSPLSLLDTSSYSEVIIASLYQESMRLQLEEMGINNYSMFIPVTHGFYDTPELVFNPYEATPEATSEAEWSSSEKLSYSRKEVYQAVEQLHIHQPLFNHIELETINRCNGSCSFCPVNHHTDPRPLATMSEDLFKSIVSQLADIQYSGRFSTFSNNEPLLDDRIISLNQLAREAIPPARMHLYTNGNLLTLDKFIPLTSILDALIIDNYQLL